eukprot:14455028-Alexandrium_andersonii.AAC.1
MKRPASALGEQEESQVGTYAIWCAGACGTRIVLTAKPSPIGTAWPKAWCRKCNACLLYTSPSPRD